jgi:hypothetical protein
MKGSLADVPRQKRASPLRAALRSAMPLRKPWQEILSKVSFQIKRNSRSGTLFAAASET